MISLSLKAFYNALFEMWLKPLSLSFCFYYSSQVIVLTEKEPKTKPVETLGAFLVVLFEAILVIVGANIPLDTASVEAFLVEAVRVIGGASIPMDTA